MRGIIVLMVRTQKYIASMQVGFGAIFIAIIMAAAWSLIFTSKPVAAAPANFVYRSGNKLMLNGSAYKFVGYNAFGVTGCEGAAWSRAQLDAYFKSLPPASMTRLWATEMYGTGTLDQVVASAEANNQKVILTLNNDLNDCVGDGGKTTAWYQSGYKNGGYLNWVKNLATKYKNSPAIGMWEVINEAGQFTYGQGGGAQLDGAVMKDFYQTVATAIKSVDPNHLVGTGDNAEFTYKTGISGYTMASSAAAIDVLSLHDYESDYISNAPTVSSHFSSVKSAADGMFKPIIIGEMNDNACSIAKTTRAANVKKSVDSYLASGAAGVLIWNYSQVYYNDCPDGEDYIITATDPVHTMIKAYSISGNNTTPTTGCTVPANYGSVTSTLSIPSDGVYTLWSRIMASSAENNSYLLELDGTSCFVVGDSSSIPANVWTWVSYQNGAVSDAMRMQLSKGTHTLKLIGREAGVKVDRVLALADATCTPVGTGDQCAPTGDTTAPIANITAPASNATVSGPTTISVNATDNVSVTKVEVYVDAGLSKTLTTAPYTYGWNATGLSNGAHTLSVKAYDAAGNVGTSTVTVNVVNGDRQVPTAPGNIQARAPSANEVTVTWAASSDNVGVAGYLVSRGGALLATVTNGTSYTDRTVAQNTQYTYQVVAYDAAGNKSNTAEIGVKTPQATTADTQAPSIPTDLVVAGVSGTQINVTWKASTDNVAVTGYDVYRAGGGAGTAKVASVTGTSFGDSGLKTDNIYTYFIIARDAVGNSSGQSVNASTAPTYPVSGGGGTTPPATSGKGTFRGTVKNSSGKVLQGVAVTMWSSEGGELKTTTNAAGVYRFDNLSTSAYFWVNFSLWGYQDQGMTVQANGDIVKNIQLESSSGNNWWQWW